MFLSDSLILLQKPFVPKKYFSIDRVFRNEAVDRTHLAEFHQIEGIVLVCWMLSYLGIISKLASCSVELRYLIFNQFHGLIRFDM